jgi:hypothetical protein
MVALEGKSAIGDQINKKIIELLDWEHWTGLRRRLTGEAAPAHLLKR